MHRIVGVLWGIAAFAAALLVWLLILALLQFFAWARGDVPAKKRSRYL